MRLFRFSSPAPVAEATITWQLLPGVLIPAAPASPAPDGDVASSAAARRLPPDVARQQWPLQACSMVQFPGFPPPESFLSRPLLVLAYPPHDLGWMHFDMAHVALLSPPALWLMSLSCPEAADVLVFSCGFGQGKMGLGAPRVEKLPHQRFLHLCLESTGNIQNPLFHAGRWLPFTPNP